MCYAMLGGISPTYRGLFNFCFYSFSLSNFSLLPLASHLAVPPIKNCLALLALQSKRGLSR